MKELDCKQPSGNPSGQTMSELISAGVSTKHNYETRKGSPAFSGRNFVVSKMRPSKQGTTLRKLSKIGFLKKSQQRYISNVPDLSGPPGAADSFPASERVLHHTLQGKSVRL